MFNTLKNYILNVCTPSDMRTQPVREAKPEAKGAKPVVAEKQSAWDKYLSEAWTTTKSVWDVIPLGLVHYNPEKTLNLGGAIPSAVRVIGNSVKALGNFASFQKNQYYQEAEEATQSWNAMSQDLTDAGNGALDLGYDAIVAPAKNTASALYHGALATNYGLAAASPLLESAADTTKAAVRYLPQYSATVASSACRLASSVNQASKNIADMVSRLSPISV